MKVSFLFSHLSYNRTALRVSAGLRCSRSRHTSEEKPLSFILTHQNWLSLFPDGSILKQIIRLNKRNTEELKKKNLGKCHRKFNLTPPSEDQNTKKINKKMLNCGKVSIKKLSGMFVIKTLAEEIVFNHTCIDSSGRPAGLQASSLRWCLSASRPARHTSGSRTGLGSRL